MQRSTRTLQRLAVLLLTLSLYGCGSSLHSGNNGSSLNQNDTPTTTTGTTPMTTSGPSGQVLLTLSQQQYTTEEPLVVTIHNSLNVPIWVLGQQPVCISLTVERMANGVWEGTGGCAPARTPRPIAIMAGNVLTQRIDYAQGMDIGAGWPLGTYRVTLRYTLSATTNTDTGVQVQSATFIIK